MERIWAPWRLAFVEGRDKPMEAGPAGCIFCDFPLPAGAAWDAGARAQQRERLVVHTRPHAFVILNKYPYSHGHIMVVPRVHVQALEDLDAASYQGFHGLIRDAVVAVKKAYQPQGLNVGMNLGKAAGAGIAEHMHCHIVPRWLGDNNFMPVLADTKVISEGIMEAYDRLQAVLGVTA